MIRKTLVSRDAGMLHPWNSIGLLAGAAALFLALPAHAQSDQRANALSGFTGFSVAVSPRPQPTKTSDADITQGADQQSANAAWRRRGQRPQSPTLYLGDRSQMRPNSGNAAAPSLRYYRPGDSGDAAVYSQTNPNVHFSVTTRPAGPIANPYYHGMPQDPGPVCDGNHGDGSGYIYPNATYIYPNGAPVIITNGEIYLGGYYYGNYSNTPYGTQSYPSVYSVYNGFPQYISCGTAYVASDPYAPIYDAAPADFYAPDYPVTYQDTSYYVTNEQRAADIEAGGPRASRAVHSAYPSDSYQAAFGDIERAWNNGKLSLLRAHIRDNDTKISVAIDGKYAYSISSGDFSTITRDALDRLDTVSFKFNSLQQADNGDVTAYGRHLYRAPSSKAESNVGKTVPFDSSDPDADAGSSAGPQKTVYVSYTLHHRADQWYIIAVSSSTREEIN